MEHIVLIVLLYIFIQPWCKFSSSYKHILNFFISNIYKQENKKSIQLCILASNFYRE